MIIVVASRNSGLQNAVTALAKVRHSLMNSNIAKEICQEYGYPIDIIYGIPINFDDELDCSAKTVNSHIHLNSGLLDEDFEILMRYAVHELVHALQHMQDQGDDQALDDIEYLDDPDELEAFQYQVEFENNVRGPAKAEEYVEDLIEYHEIPEQERQDKKQELLDKVE